MTDAGALVKLILSKSNALADRQQAFRGSHPGVHGPLSWEPH